MGAARPGHLRQRHGCDAGKNHDERQEHLGNGADQRSAARGGHGIGRHGSLHDQEIRAPVAEAQHEPQPRHHAEQFHAHGVFAGASHVVPGVGHVGGQARDDSLPSARLGARQNRQRRESGHDQEKLQNLVIDRAGQAAQVGIGKHDGRRRQHAHVEVPTEHQVQQQSQGVHGNARRENRHHREGEGIKPARLFVEAHLQVFGNGAGLAAVIERHHENAHEQHGGDGSEPIEMGGHDAVLGARSGHADKFHRA